MIGIGSVVTAVNPYWLYIKIALVAALVALLVWFGWNEKNIRAEREKYKAEAALQKATTEMYALQFNNYIQLNKEIADAIRKVKVQSNTYIDSVEVSQPPVVADGDSFILITPGVPKGLPGLSGYKNYTAGGTSADAS